MNNTRRKAIGRILDQLEDLMSDLDLIMDDEQQAYDNLPESIQESERGEHMESVIEAIEDAISSIDDARDSLNFATE